MSTDPDPRVKTVASLTSRFTVVFLEGILRGVVIAQASKRCHPDLTPTTDLVILHIVSNTGLQMEAVRVTECPACSDDPRAGGQRAEGA